jgi:hypothetical protein
VRWFCPLWPLLLSCRPVLWRLADTGQAAADMADMADTDGAILDIQPMAPDTVAVTVAATVAVTVAEVGEECPWDTEAEATTVGDGTSSILSGGAGMPRSSDLELA